MKWRQTWLLYPALLLVALVAWASSSPPGSSPDDDFHLVSAWCAFGAREGLCAPGATESTRVVPAEVLHSACYAFTPEVPGNCPYEPGQTVDTDRGNFAGYYPMGFYWAMGLFASPSLETSVLLMRIVNSLVYVAGFAALLLFTPPARRSNYALASLVTLVPLGVFVVASVNPSSWAVTAATLMWASVVELVRAESRRSQFGLAAVAVFALVLALSCRADAAVYAAMALGLAWLVTAKRDVATLIRGAVATVVMCACLVWSRSFGSAEGALTVGAAPTQEEPVDGWFERIQNVINIYAGMFGTWGLGWLDTATRAITYVLAGSVFAMAVFWGLRRCNWRKALSLVSLVVIGAALPIVFATARHYYVQQGIQPRYFLPIMILIAMIAISEQNDDGIELGWSQAVLLAVSLALANASALHVNLRRYVTGIADARFNLNLDVQWWWRDWPVPPMLIWGLGAVAFFGAGLAAVLIRDTVRSTPSWVPSRRADDQAAPAAPAPAAPAARRTQSPSGADRVSPSRDAEPSAESPAGGIILS
ncbi:MAG TPA: DUF2142 domain-containing protein [Actinomycetota bacterium]|nr:DUF2142 domain-containing protein [Actinomycetota bacterium]